MSLATTPRTRYVTIGDAAEYLSVTDRTVRNYISRGDLTGYRIGTRAIRVDLRELEALLTPIPTAAVGGRR
ncbi:excisionase [Brachybacterium sp. HMSC06H03]|uniref:helix-turn-helix domain-containing protein n=1 Tax=Brachybacterium sp. HMSC06H03 TaxID=1581127 RepID=UPI0008A60804|nr:helix-turn-helix domain-containing protein [Brachybacterium sp. HMSC06H03]OFT58147.1 excisionase [Brachybacterium sp. HMSC06H03]